jgi:hypothetical protein
MPDGTAGLEFGSVSNPSVEAAPLLEFKLRELAPLNPDPPVPVAEVLNVIAAALALPAIITAATLSMNAV